MIKAVIFDLDGTIADSRHTIIAVFQKLLVEFGFPKPSEKAILKVEAYNRSRIIGELLPSERKLDLALRKKMDDRCSAIAREVLVGITPMAGAKELLEFLKGNGVKAAIVTNRGSTTGELLGMLGLDGYFGAVVTAAHVKNPKPHPEPLLLALKQLGVGAGDALFVGDTEVDMQAGMAAGIKTMLLTKDNVQGRRIGSLLELKALLERGW